MSNTPPTNTKEIIVAVTAYCARRVPPVQNPDDATRLREIEAAEAINQASRVLQKMSGRDLLDFIRLRRNVLASALWGD